MKKSTLIAWLLLIAVAASAGGCKLFRKKCETCPSFSKAPAHAAPRSS